MFNATSKLIHDVIPVFPIKLEEKVQRKGGGGRNREHSNFVPAKCVGVKKIACGGDAWRCQICEQD